MADYSASLVTGPSQSFLESLQLPTDVAQKQAQTGLAQAQIPFTQAQTQAEQLQNTWTQAQLEGLPALLGGGNGGAPGAAPAPSPNGTPAGGAAAPAGPTPIGSTGLSDADMDEKIRDGYAPVPTAPPPQVLQRAMSASLLFKNPAYGQMVIEQWKAQVEGVNQQRSLAASNSYQAASSVANAPAGAAFETLDKMNPDLAAALKQRYANDTPEQFDKDIRLAAGHYAANTWQYSGRAGHYDNGVLIDDKSGSQVVGSDQVFTGLDPKAKQAAFDKANEMVTVGAGLPQPKYQAAGFRSAADYVLAADRAARGGAGQSPASASAASTGAPTPGAPGGNIVSGATAPTAAPAAPTAVAPRTTAPAAAPQPVDPALKTALADTTFRQPAPPRPTDQPSLTAATDQAKATVAARTSLLQQAQTDTNGAATADTYLAAAQRVLSSPRAPPAGLSAYTQALISRAMQALGITSGDYATRYQEVAKYLGNAALQNARQTYGARMTQKEVDLQLNELSPSTTMTPDAINDLIAQMRAQAKYSIDSAARTRQYLGAGNDPQQFEVWNQKYFPRQQVAGSAAPTGRNTSGATAAPTATGPNGQKLTLINGQWTPRPGGATGSW